jgi:hypothetical protein
MLSAHCPQFEEERESKVLLSVMVMRFSEIGGCIPAAGSVARREVA